MKHKVAQLAVVAALVIGVLLASGVSAAVRHTEPLPASFIVTASSALPPAGLANSDLNGDGVVDPGDLHAIASLFGYLGQYPSVADINGDFVVDILDIATVARFLGQTVDAATP